MEENIRKIIERTSRLWGVTTEEVFGRSRKQPLPFARATIAAILREQYDLTTIYIGEILNRSHCTVLHYFKLYEAEYKYNKKFHDIAFEIKYALCDATIEFREELEEEYNEIMA